ncbi:hypothetical protein JGU66_11555 [Myxococcaceae bacterium JPH2]|nr:hypothetical protein [Myxococcaceae bacterium JPH2]
MDTVANSQSPLRKAFILDAVATSAMGVMLAAGAGMLTSLLGLPVELLRWTGLALIPFGAILAVVGMRQNIPAGLAWLLIGCNAMWVVDSLLLPLSGWVQATALGTVFVVGQGLVVAVFVGLEVAGLRRAQRSSVA